jgi:predicted ATPase
VPGGGKGGAVSPDRAQQELDLQLALGTALIGPKSYGPEVKNTYSRARELCQQLGKTAQLCRVLGELSCFHYVRAEYHRARELAEEALRLAQQATDPLLLALCHWYLGFIFFSLGEYKTARRHLKQTISFYEPQQHHHPFVSLRGSDAGMSALAYDACCQWCLGYPDQALRQSEQALDLARELDHPFSLADVLCFAGCLFNAMRRDAQKLKEDSEELKQLSNEKGLFAWIESGTSYHGESLVRLGQVSEGIAQICEGIEASKTFGELCYLPGALRSLAEAQVKAGQPEAGLTTLVDAFALVEQTDERHWEAELHRLRAELLLIKNNEDEAEASLEKAIEVARQQSAKSWELRAATSLARLWQKQGRTDEAHHLLAEVFNWFTEGFDTLDLIEAKALLEAMDREIHIHESK